MSPGASRVKFSIASWSPMKSEPLTVSYAWISGESSAAFPSAALMPPSAAPEWLRVGCSFEIIATSAPASNAAIAARIPAQPAPTTSTSCLPSTGETVSEARAARRRERSAALALRPRVRDLVARLRELLEVLPEHRRELPCLAVVRVGVAPRRARVEQARLDARDPHRDAEAECLVGAELGAVELPGERR